MRAISYQPDVMTKLIYKVRIDDAIALHEALAKHGLDIDGVVALEDAVHVYVDDGLGENYKRLVDEEVRAAVVTLDPDRNREVVVVEERTL